MPTIEVRDFRFPLGDVPRDWHARGPAVSAYFDQLSVFFPVGERFFVRSVKHFAPMAEGKLEEDVTALERNVKFLLGISQRFFSPRRQLAITCALEHFTSVLGDFVLATPAVFDGSDPTMTALWRWHSAEESEHRSVAFDLHKAVGGTWFERCRAMVVVSIFFWSLVALQQVVFMAKRGILFSPREHWALFKFSFIDPGALSSLWRPALSYFRRDFHPAARGGFELIERWKQSLQQ